MTDLRLRLPEPCPEVWKDMMPSGCNRRCAACETVVHDLTNYDVAGIEKLLKSGQEVCARAVVRTDGTIATRSGSGMRRAVALLTVPLAMASASVAAAKTEKADSGSIAGEEFTFGLKIAVTVQDESGKTVKKTSVRRNGRYRVKNLPKGTYTLLFQPSCGGSWTIENVEVSTGETFVPASPDSEACIIVGKLEIADDHTLT